MSDISIFTFALVPGRFRLKIVEPSAIFMVAKITFSSPDIWRENSEILVRNSSRTINDFAQCIYSVTNILLLALIMFPSLASCISAVEEERT
jgi:hypothetical protein